MKSQVLGSVLLLATLSWKLGLSQNKAATLPEIEPTTNSNAQQCTSTDSEDERLLRLLAWYGPRKGFMAAAQECNEETSTWTILCNRQSTTLNITQVCDKLGGTHTSKTDAMTTMCEITARSNDDIVSCFDQCNSLFQCLDKFITQIKMITTDSATPTKATTTTFMEPNDVITTEREPVTTKSSGMTVGNRTERDLAVVIGGTLAGLILVMIVVILIIVVVLCQIKHKKKVTRASYSPNKVGASDRDNDSLTERYRSPHNYEAPQPADYEVFQPSSVSTVASNMPLLDIDPQPYEELEGYMRQTTEDDQDNNRVYETVKNISTQENEHSNSADGHIYFTLESRDEVHVSSQL